METCSKTNVRSEDQNQNEEIFKLIEEIKELRDNLMRQQNEGMEKFNRLKRNLTKDHKELCDSIEALIADLPSGESGQDSYSGSNVKSACVITDESDSDVYSGNIWYRLYIQDFNHDLIMIEQIAIMIEQLRIHDGYFL